MVPQHTSLVFLQYLTAVFDNVSDAILLVNIEKGGFRLLMANTTFSQITGHAEGSIGKYIEELVPPDVYRTLAKHYKRAIKIKQLIEFSYQAQAPRGSHAYTVKIIPILNTVGEPVQLAIVAKDVTELANAKQEIEQLRATTA